MATQPQRAPKPEPDPTEPRTLSGAARRAHAEALRQDFNGLAEALHAVAEKFRDLGLENADVGGVFATCRGLADTIDGAVQKTRQKAKEAVEGLQKPPRESMLHDQITTSVDPALAQRVAEGREERRAS